MADKRSEIEHDNGAQQCRVLESSTVSLLMTMVDDPPSQSRMHLCAKWVTKVHF